MKRNLTELVGVFSADRRHDSVRDSSGLIRLRLIDDMRNASPALAFTLRLRGVLREALQQANSSRLEVLHDLRGGWSVGVWRGVHNGDARERVGGVGCAGKADAGDTGECEEVRFVRVSAGTDETGYAGGDAPLVQGGCSFVLDEGDGGKDGVSISDRRVEETNESISLVAGDWESEACRREKNKWIG
jgi:hypothetical protein